MEEIQKDETQVKEDEVVTVDDKDDAKVEETLADKTFTQDEVNEIVRARLEKAHKKIYNRYGVEDKKSLDELIGKAQSYDVMKERIEAMRGENASLKEKITFLENNINPERYDDVRTYFKGKELEFNPENLLAELERHNEWLNPVKTDNTPTTTITTLGTNKAEKQPIDEKEYASKLFGVKLL